MAAAVGPGSAVVLAAGREVVRAAARQVAVAAAVREAAPGVDRAAVREVVPRREDRGAVLAAGRVAARSPLHSNQEPSVNPG